MSRRKITARYEGFSSIGDNDYQAEIMHPRGLSIKEIHRYRSRDDILRLIKHEMGKGVEPIRAEKDEWDKL